MRWDSNVLHAIGTMIPRLANNRAKEADTTSNEIIDLSPLLYHWAEGVFNVGDIRAYNGYPYRCVQAHDSTGMPNWNPEEAKSLWANYHGTDEAHALPFVQPLGSHDAYRIGEYMIFTDGLIYRCIVDYTDRNPVELPQNWKCVNDEVIPEEPEVEEVPEIVPPVDEPEVDPEIPPAIEETEAGTIENPVEYNGNMELFADTYYVQDGVTYKCTRDSGIAMYHALKDLVGMYVEVV